MLTIMAKKSEFLRIRVDERLKAAIAKAAERDVRTEGDEARYLLMKSLGLLPEEDAPPRKKASNHPN